jgi:hypothetical protein
MRNVLLILTILSRFIVESENESHQLTAQAHHPCANQIALSATKEFATGSRRGKKVFRAMILHAEKLIRTFAPGCQEMDS